MLVLRIEHAVPDFDQWKRVFDRDPADRKGSGVRRYQIYRSVSEPNYVLIDMEFTHVSEAEAFLATMQRLWSGAGKAVMHNPRACIAEVFEARDI
jgi:hypothetical protein